MPCALDDKPIGFRTTIGPGIVWCAVCATEISVSDMITYKGHVRKLSGNSAMLVTDNPMICPECGHKTNIIFYACDDGELNSLFVEEKIEHDLSV